MNTDADLKDHLMDETCSEAGGQTLSDIEVVCTGEVNPIGLENGVMLLNFKSNTIAFSNRSPGQSSRPICYNFRMGIGAGLKLIDF